MQTTAVFRNVRSFDSALDRLADAAAVLGFDAVDYGYMPRARSGDGRWFAPDIVSRNFPQRWTRGWSRYASQDPYLCSCYPRTLPLDWNDVKGAGWLTTTQRQAIAYIDDDLGFRDGISVPIHTSGGGFAFVSGVSRLRCGAWRERQDAMTEQLFLLAHAFHAAVSSQVAVAGPAQATALSPREREILHFAAAGLSAPATARAIHRSVETVRRQRKSAMSKLGAHTIAQAVARALACGVIDGPLV